MKTGYIEMENGSRIEFELYPNEAPNTVANFENLANTGFYDGVIFHRVIPGFVSQGGDPTGTGTDSNAHHFLSNLNLTDLLSSLETNKSIQFNHEVKRRS